MRFPLILQLNKAGMPHKWIDYEKAVYYICKDLVMWTAGTNEITITGGVNRISGKRSRLSVNSILAVNGDISNRAFKFDPAISNQILFRRDGNTCAYCGHVFTQKLLTRDHIIPRSRNGKNEWMNVVTTCKPCNNHKSDALLENLNMKLGFKPYVPTKHEYMMLKNFGLLDDQYDFLFQHIGANSRIPQFFQRPKSHDVEMDELDIKLAMD